MLLGSIIAIWVLYVFLGIKMPRFALISLLFVYPFFIIFCAANEYSMEAFLAVPILPVTLLSVFCSKTDLESPLWPKDAARTGLSIIFCIALLITFGLISGPAGFY